MKRILLTILLLAITISAFSQIRSVSFSTAAGYTLVDLNEAVGIDELEEWDNLGAMFKVSADYHLTDNIILVGEIGSNRLYYWEYYWTDGYYSGYRSGTDWTSNLGIHIKKYFGESFFGQAGMGLHFYSEGSGMVPGAVVQLGYDIPTSGQLSIPILFRIENVMGNGFPISIMLGSGVTFNFRR